MEFIRGSLVVVWLLFSSFVGAGTVTGLYTARLELPQMMAEPNSSQIEAGLQQVLVKVSGNTNITANPVIQGQLANASNLLQQFSFNEEGGQAQLQLDYNQALVDGLVTQTGMKPLGIQRPTVLFWLASDETKEQDYVTAENQVIKRLMEQSAVRGLPTQFPLLDLTDQSSFPVADLWGLFDESINQASARYRPDAVVAARLSYRDSGLVQLDWSFISSRGQQRLSAMGAADDVVVEMVNTVADQLFKPVASHKLSHFQSGVEVQFSNVTSFADYVQIIEFVQSLPVVSSTNVERMRSDLLVLRLELDSNEAQLQEAISVEPRLTLQQRDVDPQGKSVFSYYWQN